MPPDEPAHPMHISALGMLRIVARTNPLAYLIQDAGGAQGRPRSKRRARFSSSTRCWNTVHKNSIWEAAGKCTLRCRSRVQRAVLCGAFPPVSSAFERGGLVGYSPAFIKLVKANAYRQNGVCQRISKQRPCGLSTQYAVIRVIQHVRSMRQFFDSPQRAWRWLFIFLGLLFFATSIFVFIDWPNRPEPKDEVILLFPLLILLGGCWFFFLGAFAEDERLLRIVKVMQKLGGYS